MTGISVPTLAIMSPNPTGSTTFLISSPSFSRRICTFCPFTSAYSVPGSISR